MQPAPQAPQLAVLVFRFTSQPVDAKPSQSPNPPLQAMAHVLLEHDGVPFVPLQEAPQVPQFSELVVVFVSQPLAALPSQLPNPALHVGTQVLDAHTVEPFGFVQGLPQAPQLERLLVVLVSQPFEALPSQLPNPALQDPSVQVPLGQVVLALASEQAALQSPQSDTVAMLRSQPLLALPSQLLKLAAQLGTQEPVVQVVVPFAFVQAVPQAPQFEVLVDRLISHPLPALPSQLPKPPLHVSEQAPRLHVADALAPLHAEPHDPQLVRLVSVFVSQPLFGLPSQLLKFPLHTGVHAPATQLVEPFAFVQTAPQAPQLLASVEVAVSQPFFALPSQSAKPAAQTGTHAPAEQLVVPCAFVHA